MKHKQLVIFIEGAIVAALAMALAFIPIELPNASFDLSLGMIPLCVYAIRRGVLPGVAVGLVWGLLHIILAKAYILTFFQGFFEYPFAFAFAGFCGVFGKQIRQRLSKRNGGKALSWVCMTAAIGVFARWFWHYWAGVLIWGSYAPEGMVPWLYSLIMNGSSFLANTAMLIVIVGALVTTAPRLFLPPEQDS
jgi:thiamine transporter